MSRTEMEVLLDTLRQHERLGLVTDMDGTISPITEHPEQAQVTARCREMLGLLQAQLPLVAVVSGRSAADVRRRVDVPGVVCIGNHGLERWVDGKAVPDPSAAAYRTAVEAALAAVAPLREPGVLVEDKGVTLSLHYRQTADPSSVSARLRSALEEIADRCGLHLFAGRMVFELRPPVSLDKGTAFRALVEEFALDAAVYLGDDTTDVAALQMAQELRTTGRCESFGIGVDSPETPQPVRDHADVLVQGVPGVEDFLGRLATVHNESST